MEYYDIINFPGWNSIDKIKITPFYSLTDNPYAAASHVLLDFVYGRYNSVNKRGQVFWEAPILQFQRRFFMKLAVLILNFQLHQKTENFAGDGC